MPPKKVSKTGAILKFFAKNQEDRRNQQHNEASSDSCQVIFEKAPPGTPRTPTSLPTKWDKQLKENSLIFGEKTGRDWQNPCLISVMRKSSEKNTKKNLLDNGYDDIQGNGLFYPIDEKIRKFECNIVRCCAASNCSVAIPSTAPSTSAKIVAIVTFNFLKWFPRSRALIVCSSSTLADQWIDDMKQIGIDDQHINKIATVSAFKALKGDVGKVVVCCSAQCASKTVESVEAREMIKDIRLCIIDLKPNECCNKFKPMLSAFVVNDVFYRTVVITTSMLSTSRRTSVITKRQQTITNLQLSDWIEQTESDYAFRSSNIPPGIEIKYWNNSDINVKQLELVNMFMKLTTETLNQLFKGAIVPTKKISKLLWICWESMRAQAAQQHQNSQEIMKKVELAEFVCTIFKTLMIDGVLRAFSFYQENKDKLELVRSLEKHADFPSFIQKMEESVDIFHGKYKYLSETIDTFLRMDKNVRGVIFARDQMVAMDVQKFLKLKYQNSIYLIRVVENEKAGAKDCWPIGRIPTIFHDQKAPKIVIVPLKIRDFVSSMDNLQLHEVSFIICMDRESVFTLKKYDGPYLVILHDSYEKMRKDDGRIIVDDMKFPTRDQKSGKIGAVERYDFKFEPSRLRLNAAKMPIIFFLPKTDALKEGQNFTRIGKSQMEISSKEHTELVQRMKNVDFSEYRRKKRPFMVLEANSKDIEVMSSDDVFWNSDLQYLGDVKSSNTSKRFTEYIADRLLERSSRHKKRFQYMNEITDNKRLQMFDVLLRKLDSIFPI